MNNESIRKAKAGETIYDRGENGAVKGLHLRAFAENKIFYIFYRTKNGKQRRPKIGAFGDITLAEARKRARHLLDLVAIGEDPKADWDTSKKEKTVQELFTAVHSTLWAQPRYIASGYHASVLGFWNKNMAPALANLRLSDVTTAVVRKWHTSLIDIPYAANRSLAILSRMFRYAEEQELRPQGTNPCKLVRNHQEFKRKRYASLEELQALGPILEREAKTRPDAVAFIYLLLFSGSRPRAIERATWDQLRIFEKNGARYGVLTFAGKSTQKTGEDEVVVIPPQALAMVESLPRVPGKTITGTKLPRKWWTRIKKEIGCEDLWVRDFRRTFATIGMSYGTAANMVGELLNHRDPKTTKGYARLMDGPRVDAALSIANHVEGKLK